MKEILKKRNKTLTLLAGSVLIGIAGACLLANGTITKNKTISQFKQTDEYENIVERKIEELNQLLNDGQLTKDEYDNELSYIASNVFAEEKIVESKNDYYQALKSSDVKNIVGGSFILGSAISSVASYMYCDNLSSKLKKAKKREDILAAIQKSNEDEEIYNE